jgi:hypothetical protein
VALFLARKRSLQALLIFVLLGCDVVPDVPRQEARDSKASFDRWLAQDVGRARAFHRFESFLADRGVADVVPAWQLLRTDARQAARCGFGAFEMPREEKWPAIVPTLRLVEREVIPVVGRVEVSSADRSDELNECVKGASQSRHRAFAAVDLIAPARTDPDSLFADLCAMHRRVGPRTAMGLGAYRDPARPSLNSLGRFHIDQSGYRTWGFDYHRASSFCVKTRMA